MTLLNLIRTPVSRLSATATPAIQATRKPQSPVPVAEIAGVTVALAEQAQCAEAEPANGRQVPPQARSSIALDQVDMLFAYIERLAICRECGGATDDAAHRIASQQCGVSLAELVERLIACCYFINGPVEPTNLQHPGFHSLH